MLLIPWVTNVGVALQGDSVVHDAIIVASSPIVLSQYFRDRFDPKKNSFPALVRFKQSSYMLLITHCDDVPIQDLIDPTTGKFLIKYGKHNGTQVVEIA